MGSKTVYLEQALLGYALGYIIWTPPATLYVVASTGAFDPTLSGATVTEPVGGAYARVSIPNDSTSFPSPAGGNPSTLSNSTDWPFPVPTGDWGEIQSVYLADALTGGNLLYGTDITGGGVAVPTGQQFTVFTGDFLVRET